MRDHTWAESFIWHIRQVPFQLLHLRELAESTIGAQDTTAVRVTGGKDTAPLPYRIDPADDADNLWAVLAVTSEHILAHVGGAPPRPLRSRMWHGNTEPHGLPVCTPSDAFTMAAEVIRWLEACTPIIERTSELHDSVDHLTATIRKTRSRYPRSEPQFKTYRPRPCPICGQQTILPVWGTVGLEAMRCDTCGKVWPSNRYSTTAATTHTEKQQSESAESPTRSSAGEETDSP